MSDKMPSVPDFTGKVVSITIMDDESNHDLVDPVFEMQGGRLFLIGTTPVGATSSDWTAGVPSAVAWDRVTDYFVFDSVDAYTRAIQVSEDHQRGDDLAP